ncbi:hypothetical protein Csa_017655 [Cucumis sativus]|uniref:Uncharacterized protein n=1 Tax=Cucumis sativus TaxID=3659 RepID=A0A0A0LDX6_CUCSA|nr:hypothetical protein Csa_017655 [Cucumis sativus]
MAFPSGVRSPTRTRKLSFHAAQTKSPTHILLLSRSSSVSNPFHPSLESRPFSHGRESCPFHSNREPYASSTRALSLRPLLPLLFFLAQSRVFFIRSKVDFAMSISIKFLILKLNSLTPPIK